MNKNNFLFSKYAPKLVVIFLVASFFISPMYVVFADDVSSTTTESSNATPPAVGSTDAVIPTQDRTTDISPTIPPSTDNTTAIDPKAEPVNPADTVTPPSDDSATSPADTTDTNSPKDQKTDEASKSDELDSNKTQTMMSSQVGANALIPAQPGASITSQQIVPEPDPSTGALIYNYPIITPPGRNGIQPDLNLKYNSQDLEQNSIFGYGWSINIPYITRLNKKGADTMYTDNYFSSSLSGELVNTSGSSYFAKVEKGNFISYTFSSNTWTATDKNGIIYTFGSSASTRQDNPSDSTKVYKWMLEKIEDTNGNFILYTYYKDGAQIYPDTIIYTNNAGNAGIYEVDFLRQSRGDTVKSYVPAFLVSTNYRVNEIDIKTSGSWVNKYVFAYTTGNNTTQSLLSSVTQSGQDSNNNVVTLPSTTFSYQTANAGWTQDTTWTWPADQDAIIGGNTETINSTTPIPYPINTASGRTIFADINGDGLVDMIHSGIPCTDQFLTAHPGGCASTTGIYIYLNTGSGWVLNNTWQLPVDQVRQDSGDTTTVNGNYIQVDFSNTAGTTQPTILMDVNGDNLPDIIESGPACTDQMIVTYGSSHCNPAGVRTGKYVYLNNGTNGWTLDTSWVWPINQEFIDDGTPTTVNSVTAPLELQLYNGRTMFVDVNGDGLVDIMHSSAASCTDQYLSAHGTGSCGPGGARTGKYIYLNTGSGWVYNSSWSFPIDQNNLDAGSTSTVNGNSLPADVQLYPGTTVPFIFADVNNDGLIDILHNGSACVDQYLTMYGSNWCNPAGVRTGKYVYLNNGKGWTYDSSWAWPINQENVDGGGGYTINGAQAPFNYDTANSLSAVVDVNGDGLPDFIHHGTKCTDQMIATYGSTYCNPGGARSGEYTYTNTGSGMQNYTTTSWPVDQLEVHDQGNTTTYNGNSQPINFNFQSNTTAPWVLVDVNGDGILDMIDSGTSCTDQYLSAHGTGSCGPNGAHTGKYVYKNTTQAPLLSTITYPQGGSASVTYKMSSAYKDGSGNLLNSNLPLDIETVSQIVVNDGLGNTGTTSYVYENGLFYFDSSNITTRKFAGFGDIIKTDPVGNITKTYYFQGNSTNTSLGEYNDSYAKIGESYRIEKYDNANHLYSLVVSKWDSYNLGTGHDFVKLIRITNLTYDGTGSHKDTAQEYTYDNTYGNSTSKTDWGQVNASTDGSFTDTGSDESVENISYVANTSNYVVGLPYDDVTFDQSSSKVNEMRTYYDGNSLGTVGIGNPTKIEKWVTGSTYVNSQKSYDGTYGLVATSTDPDSNVTSYTYDSYHLYPTTVTDALTHTANYTYDYSSGKVIQKTDENGFVYQNIYDGLDRVIEQKIPGATTPFTPVTKTTYSYTDTSGAVAIHQIDYLDGSNTADTYAYYDGLNRLIQKRKEAESNYNVNDYIYDSLGLLYKESLPYNVNGSSKTSPTTTSALLTTYTYDGVNRISTKVNAVGTTSYTYNLWKTSVTDPRGKVKDLYSDARGNLIQVDEHNSGSTYTTNYTYNLNQKLLSITDALSNVRNFTYDGLGNRLTAEDLHASGDSTYGSWSYTYDNAGNMTQSISPESKTVNYTYDALNRVLTENYTGVTGTEITYAYDSCTNGIEKLCSVTMTSGANTSYTYDSNGNIASEVKTINSNAYTTAYTYDRQGNQIIITYPDSAQVRYTYNTAGLLNQVEREESGGSFTNVISNIDYSPTDQPTVIAYANNTTTTNTYDDSNLYRLSNKTTTNQYVAPTNNNPVITLTGATLINKTVGDTWTEPGYSATDTEDGTLTSSIAVTGSVNTSVTGTYQLVYAVVDSQGAAAERKIRTVVVKSPVSMNVKALVVGGGGGGGNANSGYGAGGGGGGGYQYDASHSINSQSYSVVVGNGGASQNNGSNSSFDSITANGGGAGGDGSGTVGVVGNNGGAGGGGGGGSSNGSSGGVGSQGHNGGSSLGNFGYGVIGGGGGGAGTAGANSTPGGFDGIGGTGTSNSISGSSITYAGGGGGGVGFNSGGGSSGGSGGGGNGRGGGGGQDGTNGLGGGGGGGGNGGSGYYGKNGGSGIVIISYLTDGSNGVDSSSTGGTKTTSGGYTIHTFNNNGTFTAVLHSPTNNNPVITLNGSTFINKTVGDTWTEPGYSATDTEDGTITGSVTTTGSVNTATAGTYQIVYAVVDSQGAPAERKIRTVVVHEPASLYCLQNTNYTYDSNGNITQIVDASDLDSKKTVTYTYDDLNRMLSATATNVASGQSTYTQNFTYNAIGNITSGPVGSYTYAGNSGTNYANPHAATSINSVTNTYNHDGDVLTDGILTNTWNYKDQLATSTNGTFTRTYLYDENGNRVSSDDGTNVTVYPNKYYTYDGTTKTKDIYAGDTLVATVTKVGSTVTPYYVHTDNVLGSSVISDSSGEQNQLLDYMPFGQVRINQQATSFNEIKQFGGHYLDGDTGLNYFGARFYRPTSGQFISEDPVFVNLNQDKLQKFLEDPQSQNSYAFARNNPIINMDPDGKYWEVSASGTDLGLSGAIGFRFDSSGLNFFVAGGAGIGVEGSLFALSYIPEKLSHTTDTKVSVGGSIVPGIGLGAGVSGDYEPSTYSLNNKSFDGSVILGIGADVYTRKEVSIPILGRQPQTGDSLLDKPTYLSAPKTQQSQSTSNNSQSDYYLYPGKYTNTAQAQTSSSVIKNQKKSN